LELFRPLLEEHFKLTIGKVRSGLVDVDKQINGAVVFVYIQPYPVALLLCVALDTVLFRLFANCNMLYKGSSTG
jgi:hypothetical protein